MRASELPTFLERLEIGRGAGRRVLKYPEVLEKRAGAFKFTFAGHRVVRGRVVVWP